MPPSPFLLYTAMLILAGAVVFHLAQKEKWSLVSLLVSAFLFYYYSATLFPFLNLWDERFHALVAKHFLSHPFKPTLYDEQFAAFAPENWSMYHIWLHKQPLFMWQMAIGFKLFGLNETAMRIPNVILCVAMVYAAWRSGYLLGNKNVAFYTAFLTVTASYTMKLVSGRYPSDQNDTSFLAYCTLSIWAWVEYEYSRKKYWLVLVGTFSGAAILCKWLAGLLVYAAWGFYSIVTNKTNIAKYKDILLAFLATTAVAAPWQIYCMIKYPAEASAAFDLNSKHFTEAVDGHEGTCLYHFERMGELFGSLTLYLIIPSFAILVYRISNKKLGAALFFAAVIVYAFFTLAVTKMPSFTVIALLPMYLALAFLLDLILNVRKPAINVWLKACLIFCVSGFIALDRSNFNSLRKEGAFTGIDDAYYRKVLSHNKEVLSSLKLPAGAIIFNNGHFIETMFYSDHLAFLRIPTEEMYKEVKNKKRPIVILTHGAEEKEKMPTYLLKDPLVIFMEDPCFD